jgi:hypothetical protein
MKVDYIEIPLDRQSDVGKIFEDIIIVLSEISNDRIIVQNTRGEHI